MNTQNQPMKGEGACEREKSGSRKTVILNYYGSNILFLQSL